MVNGILDEKFSVINLMSDRTCTVRLRYATSSFC